MLSYSHGYTRKLQDAMQQTPRHIRLLYFPSPNLYRQLFPQIGFYRLAPTLGLRDAF